jgi:hypothetical protein
MMSEGPHTSTCVTGRCPGGRAVFLPMAQEAGPTYRRSTLCSPPRPQSSQARPRPPPPLPPPARRDRVPPPAQQEDERLRPLRRRSPGVLAIAQRKKSAGASVRRTRGTPRRVGGTGAARGCRARPTLPRPLRLPAGTARRVRSPAASLPLEFPCDRHALESLGGRVLGSGLRALG